MSLFQNSVLNKYLKGLESEKVTQAYVRFTNHFHNPTIQENIRNSKEEQYQGEFLIDLFVNVFGYVKNPTPDFNLTTELKNIKGSKKTDGAILKGEKALAVIELKGTNTTDLSKVETQAFGYKNNQPGCNYVITSNFEKLRFYIDNAVDFEEFNLFQLSKESFDILWLCLSSEYLLKDIPKKIKDESLTQEEHVTKKLYKDYASFRNEIFDAIQKENPEFDKLTLFKKTQKLLDRFLFIFFAEDRLLLPPNSIRSIVNQWTDLRDKYDEYFPLYDRFKKYFGYMNTGHKGQQHDIFAYNGGLFEPDEILDNIKINDDLLHKHTINLSNYDFESEVSVNILGHIFEHSLNDIDEIQSEIQGVPTEQSKTKRKKDGVFYTPKYITKYIVDNTVGKLCDEKKIELDIQEAEYEKERKGRKKATLKNLTQKLEDYRKWLLQITICDPACGSGAFLNQALEFLIAEHQYIDELQAKLFGDAMVLSEVENAILENNIYGVDINDESVEIAKLSLWLRTAQKGRKLTSLNNNIKCGNSLIDDQNVAGDKAFSWKNEFPNVFKNGGFDAIIGNPPYVRQELLGELKKDLIKTFPNSGNGTADLYIYFYELAFNITRESGKIGFITPNKWFKTKYGLNLRRFLKDKNIVEITDFFELNVFEDASTEPQIFISNCNNSDNSFIYSPVRAIIDFQLKNEAFLIDKDNLKESEWIFLAGSENELLNKLHKNSVSLGENTNNGVKLGIKTALNKAFIIDKKTKEEIIKADPESSKLIENYANATDIKKWHLENKGGTFLINTGYDIEISESSYSGIYHYLNQYKEELFKRQDKGKTPYNLRACDYYDSFKKSKIIFIHTAVNHYFFYDEDGTFVNNNSYIISNCSPIISLILNSPVFQYIKRHTFGAFGDLSKGGRARLNHEKMSRIPIPLSINDKVIKISEEYLSQIKSLSNQLLQLKSQTEKLLKIKFGINKLSKKLSNWHELEFGEFLKELEKARKKAAKENHTTYTKLSLGEEAEWMQYFNEQKEKAQPFKTEIDKTDREINQMVYELYGLTKEEINIVEEATA